MMSLVEAPLEGSVTMTWVCVGEQDRGGWCGQWMARVSG